MLLAARVTEMAGLALAASLLTAFSVGIAVSARQGPPVPCRCFGPSETPFGYRHVVRNSLLIAVAVTGGLAATPGGSSELHPAAIVVAVAAACVAALVIRVDDLVDLFAGPPAAARVGRRDPRARAEEEYR